MHLSKIVSMESWITIEASTIKIQSAQLFLSVLIQFLTSNDWDARVANLKHCRPTGIPIIVIHHMHPAKIHASPPSNPPNINQRILPIVLMTIHPPYPMFNILLQFPLLSHISL